MTPHLIAVTGPTGCGKSALAEALADSLSAELVNADAFQVYRGLDIGTNKPTDKSKYHLLDVVDPSEGFGVGQWINLVLPILSSAWNEGRSVIIVGGTGFYIRALFEEYQDMNSLPDMELRQELMDTELKSGLEPLVARLVELDPNTKVDLRNGVRVRRAIEKLSGKKENVSFEVPAFKKTKLMLSIDVPSLDNLLKERVRMMIDNGWPEEVSKLLQSGVPISSPGFRAIGYQSVARYVNGEMNRAETEEHIHFRTRQYAKRQRTWLRSEPNLIKLDTNNVFIDGISYALDHALKVIRG